MLGLVVIGVILFSVASQDLIGVNYSFDIDFEKTFNNKTCDKYENWKLIDYASLNSTLMPRNSQKGIKSKRISCTTSFPIMFFDNSILELDVFLHVLAGNSGLKTTIFDENNIAKETYAYNKISVDFKPGWSTISIAIHTNTTGYINLVGHSGDNEIVLVDSFRYITKNLDSSRKNEKFSNTSTIYESDGLIENIHEPLQLLFDNEGSGDEGIDGSGEEYDSHIGEELEDDDDLDEKGVTRIEE